MTRSHEHDDPAPHVLCSMFLPFPMIRIAGKERDNESRLDYLAAGAVSVFASFYIGKG
jgi:hypothetical protein